MAFSPYFVPTHYALRARCKESPPLEMETPYRHP